MRREFLLISMTAFLLASCGQTRFAERYATRMAEVLKTYRTQVDAKIKAEQQSYSDLATIYDEANVERVRNSLLLERNRRATETVDRLTRQKAASPAAKVAWISQIQAEIESFAELDFEQSQSVFSRELDAYKASIAGLASLSQEQANLDQLKDSLESLAKPKTIVQKLKAAGQFGCEVNRNQQLLETGQKIDDVTKQIAAEKDADKKKAFEKQMADLEAQKQKLGTPCKVE